MAVIKVNNKNPAVVNFALQRSLIDPVVRDRILDVNYDLYGKASVTYFITSPILTIDSVGDKLRTVKSTQDYFFIDPMLPSTDKPSILFINNGLKSCIITPRTNKSWAQCITFDGTDLTNSDFVLSGGSSYRMFINILDASLLAADAYPIPVVSFNIKNDEFLDALSFPVYQSPLVDFILLYNEIDNINKNINLKEIFDVYNQYTRDVWLHTAPIEPLQAYTLVSPTDPTYRYIYELRKGTKLSFEQKVKISSAAHPLNFTFRSYVEGNFNRVAYTLNPTTGGVQSNYIILPFKISVTWPMRDLLSLQEENRSSMIKISLYDYKPQEQLGTPWAVGSRTPLGFGLIKTIPQLSHPNPWFYDELAYNVGGTPPAKDLFAGWQDKRFPFQYNLEMPLYKKNDLEGFGYGYLVIPRAIYPQIEIFAELTCTVDEIVQSQKISLVSVL